MGTSGDVGNKAAPVAGLATGYLYGQKFTQDAVDAALVSISFYAYAVTNVGVALYSHDGANNKPASPLTTKQTVTAAAGWNTVVMTGANQITLSASTVYWIVFEMQADGGVGYSGNGGRRSYKGSWTYGTALPDPWGTSGEDATYQADVYWTYSTWSMAGVTRDADGNALGSCTVCLFKTSDKSYYISVTSNASTGAFAIYVLDGTTAFFIRAYKDGSPNVFGTTDDDLVGT